MSVAERRLPSIFLVPFVLFLVGILLFVSLLVGGKELTVLILLLFGVAAGAGLWSRLSLAGISCRAGVDKNRLFPGERLELRAQAENRKMLPVGLELSIPVEGPALGESAGVPLKADTSLLWRQKAVFHWELTALCRGVSRIGPLAVASGDLFGFFSREKKIAGTIEVVVYPRLVSLVSPSLPRRESFGVPGAESPVEDPVFILGTRDYQYGRPAKYIHWKATARHSRLQEKIFEPSAQEKLLLVLDVAPFARQKAHEAFERTLEKIASVAVRLAGRGCAVGLIANGRIEGEGSAVLPVSRNQPGTAALLETLARLRMEADRDLLETLHVHLKTGAGTSCLYFSCGRDETAQGAEKYFMKIGMPCLFFPDADVAGVPGKSLKKPLRIDPQDAAGAQGEAASGHVEAAAADKVAGAAGWC